MPEPNWEFAAKDYQIVTEQYRELKRLKDKGKISIDNYLEDYMHKAVVFDIGQTGMLKVKHE